MVRGCEIPGEDEAIAATQAVGEVDGEAPKPTTEEAFLRWGEKSTTCAIKRSDRTRYNSVVLAVRAQLEESDFWRDFLAAVKLESQEYYLRTKYKLLPADDMLTPRIEVKSADSAVEKCYRKNVILNDAWPTPPKDGWVTPATWFESFPDNVRTQFVVKYLDGVQALVTRIESYLDSTGTPYDSVLHARDYGYYGAHIVFRREFEIPGTTWETENSVIPIEIQVRTELQDVIGRLTHKYYQARRLRSPEDSENWQWRYDSEEFVPNYLGHILHYVEGMIMEVRNRPED